MKKKPALFIDFDGTLCHNRFWKSLGKENYDRVSEFVFGSGELANGWMRGDYDSEQICQIVSDKLKIDYQILWGSLIMDCESLKVLPEDLEKIDLLRKRYTTAIVTVNMDCFDRFIVPGLGLFNHFDFIINSCKEGVFKCANNRGNKAGLIEIALSKTNADAGRSILIDDLKNACDYFEKIGGRAMQVDSRRQLGYWLDVLLKF